MSGETDTVKNRFNSILSRLGRYIVAELGSDRAELSTGGKNTEDENTDGDKPEDKETKVDLDNPEVKAAIAAKVEEVIGDRINREKSKITAAEAKAKEAEEKLATAEQTIATLTGEKDTLQTSLSGKDYDILVYKLAIEESVTPALIKSLKGTTEEELKASLKLVSDASKGKVNRLFDGKESGKSDGGKDLSAIIQAAAKKARN